MANHTPTSEQVLKVMGHEIPGHLLPYTLVNGAWAAIDVARALPSRVTWMQVDPIMQQLAQEGRIVQVHIRGHKVPRYRLLGT